MGVGVAAPFEKFSSGCFDFSQWSGKWTSGWEWIEEKGLEFWGEENMNIVSKRGNKWIREIQYDFSISSTLKIQGQKEDTVRRRLVQNCFLESLFLETVQLDCQNPSTSWGTGWFLPFYLKSHWGLHWDPFRRLKYLILQPRNDEPSALEMQKASRGSLSVSAWSQMSAAALRCCCTLACIPRICHATWCLSISFPPCRREGNMGGLGSCPVGPFEEAMRPWHKEARGVPHGLRRKLQDTTQNEAASTSVKGTAGMPPLNICLPIGHRTTQSSKNCFIPWLLCTWAQSSQQVLGGEEVRRARSMQIIHPSSVQALWLKQNSWDGKTAKAITDVDYLLLHRIKHSNHLRLCLYLKMSIRLLRMSWKVTE